MDKVRKRTGAEWMLRTVIAMTAAMLLAGAGLSTPLRAQSTGETVYKQNCAQCHGEEGDGKGHAFKYTRPRPRDLTSGMFKFRHTESGEYPTHADLAQMIRDGMPGTSMPPWGKVLSNEEIEQVASHIQRFFMEEDDEKPEAIPIGKAPAATPESIKRGRELFEKLECTRCHGNAGRGDGNVSMTFKDDWNQEPIYPRNFEAGWLFRGGRRAEDIYRTVMFGLGGTPMPAHIEEEALKEESDRWALALYVLSIGPSVEPEARSAIISRFVEEEIPLAADDPLWQRAEQFYVSLAGQVVLEPRLLLPSVRYVWVQSLYNGRDIGLRIQWVDSTSTDNEALTEGLRKRSEESGEPAKPVPPDELIVQFPAKTQLGGSLPYFLMGKPGKPVNLWVWTSASPDMANAKTSRFGAWKEIPEGTALASSISYQDGLYTLTMRRAREGNPGEVAFASDPGIIPITFSAVDGFKGEGGHKRAVASWTNLLLEQPVGMKVYLIPLLIFGIIAALEWRLVKTTRANAGKS